MEKAVECFHRAYEGSRSRKALETYLLAVGVTRTPAEYQSVVRRLGVEKEVLQDIKEKLAKFSKKPEVSADLDNPDEILQKLTREYHRSTESSKNIRSKWEILQIDWTNRTESGKLDV